LRSNVGQIEQYPVKCNFSDKVLILFGEVMAQVCEICGKGPQFGNNISHAHNVTKRIRVCTSCLRSGKVVKA